LPVALIVDDDNDSSLALADVIRQHGYTLETADSLASARDALLRQMPEVAIINEQVGGEVLTEGDRF